MHTAPSFPAGTIENLAVIIASSGRHECLAATLRSLLKRRSRPEQVIVVGTDPADLPEAEFVGTLVEFRISERRGSTVQRNVGIVSLKPTITLVGFLDDDVEVHDDYCAEIANVFGSHPEVIAFSGCVLANGNIDRNEARVRLDGHQIPIGMPPFGAFNRGWCGLYGCTMNFRRSAIAAEPFDENLPLYGLNEDIEIGFRMHRHGAVGGSARCVIVHLRESSGRIDEVGVGFAQIVNQLYLARKGIGYPLWSTIGRWIIPLIAKNLIETLLRRRRTNGADYRARLKGNGYAFLDLLRGRIDPRRLEQIVSKSHASIRT